MKTHNRFARALALLLSFLMAFDTQTVTAFAAAQENPDVAQIAEAQVSGDTQTSDELNTAGEEDEDAVTGNATDSGKVEVSEDADMDSSISDDAEPAPTVSETEEKVGAALGYTYYIVYEGNGSDSGNMSQQTVNKTPFTLTKNKYVKAGYTFDKWLVTAVNTYDGSGDPVSATDPAAEAAIGNEYVDWAEIGSALTETPDATVVLQAQWKANEYSAVVDKVTVDGELSTELTTADIEVNGTAATSYTVTFAYNEANKQVPAAATVSTKPGYVFVGYTQTYTGYDGAAKNLAGDNATGYTLDTAMVDTSDVSKRVLLTANFEKAEYDITFETEGGEEGGTFAAEWIAEHEDNKISNVTVESGVISTPAVTVGTPDTKEFAGWRIKTGGTSGGFLDVKDFPTITMKDIFANKADADPDGDGTVTLVAEYRDKTFTVKFVDADGTTVIAQKKNTLGADSLSTILGGKGEKLGYTLAWKSEGDVDITGKVSDDTTLNELLWDGGTNANTDGDDVIVIKAEYEAVSYTIRITSGESGFGDDVVISNVNLDDNDVRIAANEELEMAVERVKGKALVNFDITVPIGKGTVATESLAVANVKASDVLAKIGEEPAGRNITLSCVFTTYQYNVVFAGDDETRVSVSMASTAMVSEALEAADAVKLDEIMAGRTGYTAVGWTIEGQEFPVGGPAISSTPLSEVVQMAHLADTNGLELVFTPMWRQNSYILRYDGNGATSGAVAAQADCLYTQMVTVAEQGTLARTGYNFKGWSTARDGSVEFEAGEEVSKLATGAAGDTVVTLYAVWAPVTYKIYLKPNTTEPWEISDDSDVEDYPEYIVKTYGEDVELPEEHYVRVGHIFKGWNTQPGGLGTGYAAGAAISTDLANTQDAETEIYAQWESIRYNIHFNKNRADATDAPDDIEGIAYGAATDLDPGDMTSPTAAFLYWCDSADGEGNIYYAGERNFKLTAENGATVELYAIWEKITYTVIYDGNGGVLTDINDPMPTETVDTEAGKVTFAQNKYVKAGYVFTGWKVTKIKYPSGYTQNVSGIDVYEPDTEYTVILTDVKDATVTMAAQWAPITYDLVFDVNGADEGSYEEMESIVYDDRTVVLPDGAALTYYGYEFLGWSANKTATEAEYSADNGFKFLGANGQAPNLIREPREGIERDATLYAVWRVKTYDVTVYAENGTTPVGEAVTVSAGDTVATVVTALKAQGQQNALKKNGHVLHLTSDIDGVTTYTKDSEKTFRAMMQDAHKNDVTAITLTESWQAITYTIEFTDGLGNAGAAGSMANVEAVYGANTDGHKYLPLNTYHRPGYKFIGWKIGKVVGTEESAAEIWADEDVNAAMAEGTLLDTRTVNIANEYDLYAEGELTQLDYNGIVITLEAQWKGVTYTIKYQKDEADDAVTGDAPADQLRQYGSVENNKLAANTFTKNGYAFKHWKIASAKESAEPGAADIDEGRYLVTSDEESVLTDEAVLSVSAGDPAGGTELTWVVTDGAVITLQAVFEPDSYAFRFVANGGTFDVTPGDVPVRFTGNDPAVQVSDEGITRKGYTFAGFDTVSGGDGVEVAKDTDIDLETLLTDQGKAYADLHVTKEGNVNYITLYAQWTENQYNVILDPNQNGKYKGTPYVGKVKIGEDEVNTENDNIAKIENKKFTDEWNVTDVTYTREGYELVGWAVGTESNVNTANGYVTDLEHGFVAKNATGLKISELTGLELAEDVTPRTATLYAVWKPIGYTLKFEKGDSTGKTITGTMEDQKVDFGARTVIRSTAYKAKGYLFDGWKVTKVTKSDSTELTPEELETAGLADKTFAFNEYFIEENASLINIDGATITLTAQWKPVEVEVDFVQTEEEEALPENKITGKNYSDTITTLDDVFQVTGKTVAGWTISGNVYRKDSEVAISDFVTNQMIEAAEYDSLTNSKKVTVKAVAKWDVAKYYILFAENEPSGAAGSVTGSMNVLEASHGEAVTLPANAYTLDGYIFRGWATSHDGEVVYADRATIPGEDVTHTMLLYAVWREEPVYLIKFDKNADDAVEGEGSIPTGFSFIFEDYEDPDSEQILIKADTPINMKAVINAGLLKKANDYTRKGYDFVGWNTQADLSGNDILESEENVTVAGKFSAEQYAPVGDETLVELTLYAKWNERSYTVSYDGNGSDGGSTAANAAALYTGSVDLTENGFTKTGYHFMGWATNDGEDAEVVYADATTAVPVKVLVEGHETETGITLYAVWEANTYKVSYDANGGTGTGTVADQTVVYGVASEDAPIALYDNADNKFKRIGYTFAGWAKNSRTAVVGDPDYLGAEIKEDLTTEDNATVTLYAVWVANSYTVKYDLNGADEESIRQDRIVKFDEIFKVGEKQTGDSDLVVRTGYKFAGWKTAVGENFENEEEASNLTMKNGDTVTITAQWTPNTYTIRYNKGLGEVTGEAPADTLATYGAETALAENTFVHTGYDFVGWALTEDAEDSAVLTDPLAADASLTAVDEAVVNVYAIWAPSDVVITFNANGGTGDDVTQTVTRTKVAELPEVRTVGFEKEGYSFNYWTKTEDGSGQQIPELGSYTVSATEEAPTFYAQWKPNTYTIVYHANGGEEKDPLTTSSATYDSAVVFTDVEYTRTGYSFVGWGAAADTAVTDVYADNDADHPLNLTSVDGGVVDVYAVWSDLDTKVTFKANGGAGEDYVQEGFLQDIGKALTGNEIIGFTRTGYTFKGWSTVENAAVIDAEEDAPITDGASYTVSADERAAGGAVLYAVWAVDTYKVKYDINQGTGAIAATSVDYDAESFTINANGDEAVKRVGYNFLGWALDKDAETPDYSEEKQNLTVSGAAVKAFFGTADPADVTLYAVWQPINYTIVFMPNGDNVTGEMDEIEVEFDQSLDIPENKFERIGYKFTQWSTSTTAGEEDIIFADKASIEAANLWTKDGEKVYFYAQWEALPYTITFDLQGGEENYEPVNTYYDTAVLLPATATKEGFQFQGWSRTADAAEADFAISNEGVVVNPAGEFEAGAEVKLYAVWGHTTYKVTLYSNAEVDEAPLVVDDAAVPAMTIATILGDVRPVRKYYSFLGWSDEKDDELPKFTTRNTVDEVAYELTSDDTTGAIVLYAIWKVDSYTLTYNRNASATDSVKYETDAIGYDEDVTLASDANALSFANPGTTLVRWNTKADGTGTAYELGAVVSAGDLFGAEPKDTELYAVWSDSLYTVDYDRNLAGLAELASLAGVAAPAITGTMKQQKDVTKDEKLLENTFAAEGYEVIGWTTDGTDDAIDITDAKDDTVLDLINLAGDRSGYKLRATWKFTDYTITFHGIVFEDGKVIGGKEIRNNVLTYNMSESVVLPTIDNIYALSGINPDKYEFVGFYTDSAFKVQVENIGKDGEVKQGNIDVYARMNPKPYTITFKASGEAGAMSSTQDVYFGADAVLNAVTYTKAGYVHVGWSTTPFNESAPGSMTYALKGTISAAQLDALYATNPDGLTLYPYFANSNSEFAVKLFVIAGDTISSDSFTREGTVDGYDVYTGTYHYGTGMTLPVPSTMEGQTFIGWFDENGSQVGSITKTDAKDFVLRARYKTTTYTVTFNNNAPNYMNAANGRQVKSKVSGKVTAILLEHTAIGKLQSLGTPALTAKGFTLVGWSSKPVANINAYNADEDLAGILLSPNYYYGTVTSNMTLYAVWSMDVHTLTIVDPLSDEDDIELPLTIEGIASLTSTLDSLDLLDGFDHDTSYTLSGFAATMTGKASDKVKSGYVTDLKLYARYSGVYNVTLHDGLESDATKIQKNCKLQSIKALPANAFKNPGHVFIGWSDSEGGTVADVVFGNKQVLSLEQVCERLAENESGVNNIDLYAVWADLSDTESLTFKVDFVVNETAEEALSGDYSDVTYTYGTADLDVRTYTAVKPGYTFKGWFTQPVGGKQVKKISKKSVGDITLYARFTGNKVDIVYDAESANTPIFGAVPKTKNATKRVWRDKVVTIAKVSGKAAGYTFVGWSLNDQAEAITVADLGVLSVEEYRNVHGYYAAGQKIAFTDIEDAMLAQDIVEGRGTVITLHAVWLKNEYSYNFETQGAVVNTKGLENAEEIGGAIKYTYTADQSSLLPEATKPGYTFQGWGIVKVTTNKKTGITTVKYTKSKLKKFQTKDTSTIIYPIFKLNK